MRAFQSNPCGNRTRIAGLKFLCLDHWTKGLWVDFGLPFSALSDLHRPGFSLSVSIIYHLSKNTSRKKSCEQRFLKTKKERLFRSLIISLDDYSLSPGAAGVSSVCRAIRSRSRVMNPSGSVTRMTGPKERIRTSISVSSCLSYHSFTR